MLVRIIKIGFEASWEPQEMETKGWKPGDIVDLTDPTVQLRNGLVVRVDVDGNELSPTPTMPTPEGSLKTSPREYFNSLFNNTHKKDGDKFSKAIAQELDDTLSHLARVAMLETAIHINGTRRREHFLDHEGVDFLRSFKEIARQETMAYVDDTANRIDRLPPSIT